MSKMRQTGLFEYEGDDRSEAYRKLQENCRDGNLMLREQLEDMWQDFKHLADNKFIGKFARTMEQRYWEMYLGATLIRKGFDPSSEDSGPDFELQIDDQRIWIEATCPTAGDPDNSDRIPEMPEKGSFDRRTQDRISLRVSGSLKTKREALQEDRDKGRVSHLDPFIIAVSVNAMGPWATSLGDPAIVLSTLFPIGQQKFVLDPEINAFVHAGFEPQKIIRRANSSLVDKNFFEDEGNSVVSAVLWSNRTMGMFWTNWGDDFILVHNPTACTPLPQGLFKFGRELVPIENGMRIVDHRQQ